MSHFRIGHGYDIHRLQTGGVLMLGGVKVADDISPIAHSDGDVVIHALVDAILGACSKGDIGEHFPDTDPQWKNAPSLRFLESAMVIAHNEDWAIANADITVLLEKPKLKPHKQAMVTLLTKVLQSPCNLKAGTNEGLGEIGGGQAVAAHAVVLLVRAR
jgi:2-C-methyl-D-erythritol 2,4-cyclodiphosphate synthase